MELPDNTVIDGEVIAFDQEGRPSFSSAELRLGVSSSVYYVFDVVVLAGQKVMGEPLQKRHELLVGWARL